jgi:hypothetical protein
MSTPTGKEPPRRGGRWRPIVRLLIGRRAEERDWQHTMVLATRRIQQVYQSLARDIEDVRSLQTHLTSAKPEFQQLQSVLHDSSGRIGELERQLSEHRKLLHEGAERTGNAPGGELYEGNLRRIEELEGALLTLRQSSAEVQERQSRTIGDLLTQNNQRLAELAEHLRAFDRKRGGDGATPGEAHESAEADALRAEIETLRGELAASGEANARLEARLRELEDALDESEARHLEELTDVTSHSEVRIKELDRRSRELEAARVALEATHARELVETIKRGETRINELE